MARRRQHRRKLRDDEAEQRGLVKTWNTLNDCYVWSEPRTAERKKVATDINPGDVVRIHSKNHAEFGTVLKVNVYSGCALVYIDGANIDVWKPFRRLELV